MLCYGFSYLDPNLSTFVGRGRVCEPKPGQLVGWLVSQLKGNATNDKLLIVALCCYNLVCGCGPP